MKEINKVFGINVVTCPMVGYSKKPINLSFQVCLTFQLKLMRCLRFAIISGLSKCVA